MQIRNNYFETSVMFFTVDSNFFFVLRPFSLTWEGGGGGGGRVG